MHPALCLQNVPPQKRMMHTSHLVPGAYINFLFANFTSGLFSSIRLMSYNILADLYLDLKQKQEDLYFPFCPKEYQEYSYRYPVLLKEIPGADICFIAFRWPKLTKKRQKVVCLKIEVCINGSECLNFSFYRLPCRYHISARSG